MVIEIIAIWILSICSIGVGYLLGSRTNPQEIIEKVQKEIRKKSTPAGPVIRPSPEKVNQWANKEQELADEEFKRSFKQQHPEIETP